jgi:dinuclear metal center YbgI/SA1388 family protein
MKRTELEKYLNKLLNIYDFTDYCPNGLQIEGSDDILKIGFAVSATADSVEKSVSQNCNALIVHHGLFWKFHGPKVITKAFAKRVKPLIQNDISLLGYHLPLDANMEIGNAVEVAKKIDLIDFKPFGDYKGCPTGVSGKFKTKISAKDLNEKLNKILGRDVLLSSPDEHRMLSSMGIITGGANSDWILAKRNNLDAYLTGEISEHDWHEAKESNIHFFAGGHNATEKFGIQALKAQIEKDHSIECVFFDSDNPA